MAPVGGRAARDAATGPLPGVKTPTWAAISSTRIPASAASRSTSATPRALPIAKDMIRVCDVVAEGFSPGVLQRLASL